MHRNKATINIIGRYSRIYECVKSTVVACIIYTISLIFGLYRIWLSETGESMISLVFSEVFNENTGQLFDSVLYIYLNAAWIFPLFFQNMLCVLIFHSFKMLNKEFVREIKINPVSILIWRYRKKHQEICKLIEVVDNDVHVMAGFEQHVT